MQHTNDIMMQRYTKDYSHENSVNTYLIKQNTEIILIELHCGTEINNII